MRAAGNEHLLTRVTYAGTGHLIEPPFSPHFRSSNFRKVETGQKAMLLWGGRTKPHSDAQQDAWRKILAFLQQHLYRRATLTAKM
ncbi:peroxisomal succinyl-coenzyme A thioesterase-like [Plectropomus leopardus]|uniref:peroxisomal succinyl-coenzyme A thioesterase-like n=1 Tax=Plectropomus leopardus TaxID=160734 RepID=UPI001C4CB4BD|nr:peroxisomal succinyl-coenzyme A thioesterase-like [Plectropomus leopardus]